MSYSESIDFEAQKKHYWELPLFDYVYSIKPIKKGRGKYQGRYRVGTTETGKYRYFDTPVKAQRYRDNTLVPQFRNNHKQIVQRAIKRGHTISPEVLREYADIATESKQLPMPALKWLPEYIGVSPTLGGKKHVIITKAEVVEAINKGRKHVPNVWFTDIAEMAMIPKVWAHLHKLTSGGNNSLKRVEGGYVLEGWNSPDRPYASTVHDGLRRHFHTIPLSDIRHLIYSKQEGKDVAIPRVEQSLRDAGITFHNVGGAKAKVTKARKPRKPKPLPPDAINPQVIRLNSKEATCYGKRDKRGNFRSYCRVKKD